MSTPLLPCPFCGGSAVILRSWLPSHKTFSPSCDGQNGQCPGENMEQDEQGGFCAEYPTEEDAIEAWNTRKESPNET